MGSGTARLAVTHVDISRLRWDEGWFYGDLRIQSDPTVHCWLADNLRDRFDARRVLDIGAGAGALAQQLIDRDYDVCATSWDEQCRADCRAVRLDLDHPFGPNEVGLVDDERYDAALAVDVIEHVENPHAFLRSCAGVVKRGGVVIVSTPNVESSLARLQWLLRGGPSDFGPTEIRTNRHISMIWRWGLDWAFDQAGLEIAERRAFGFYRRLPAWKRWILHGLTRVLPGDPAGTTRLVVGRKTRSPRQLAAGEVY